MQHLGQFYPIFSLENSGKNQLKAASPRFNAVKQGLDYALKRGRGIIRSL